MSTAIISECGTYRYVLTRRIPSVLRWVKPCLFIMLNPSIADAQVDDPTIRRCLGFATLWGCTSLTVVNLFALRATDPKALLANADPIGPDNDHIVEQWNAVAPIGGVVVAAWGAHAMACSRTGELFRDGAQLGVQCLGYTASGAPRHPLYVRADAQLVPWPRLEAA